MCSQRIHLNVIIVLNLTLKVFRQKTLIEKLISFMKKKKKRFYLLLNIIRKTFGKFFFYYY